MGIQLVKYGKRSKSQYHLLDFSTPELKKLAAQFHVSANLGVPLGDNSVLTIHSEMPETSVLAYQSMPTNPLHCSSMGKNILAHSSDKFISNYYKNNKIEQLTPNTITTYEDFMKVRKGIITSGVAFDDEEYELGLSCISAPIFGENGDVEACIGLSGATQRMNSQQDTIISALRSSAKLLSEKANIWSDF